MSVTLSNISIPRVMLLLMNYHSFSFDDLLLVFQLLIDSAFDYKHSSQCSPQNRILVNIDTQCLLSVHCRLEEDIWPGTSWEGSVTRTGSVAPMSPTWRHPSCWGKLHTSLSWYTVDHSIMCSNMHLYMFPVDMQASVIIHTKPSQRFFSKIQ